MEKRRSRQEAVRRWPDGGALQHAMKVHGQACMHMGSLSKNRRQPWEGVRAGRANKAGLVRLRQLPPPLPVPQAAQQPAEGFGLVGWMGMWPEPFHLQGGLGAA